MRPLRLLLSLAFCLFCIILLLTIISRNTDRIDGATDKHGRFSALFSFHTPLFPPSAIISLTDDNSTFFLARPAAFGPLLPSKGLSGQLWIGSGFGDDNLGRGGLTAGAEGELGCSDVPGWDAGAGRVTHIVTERPTTHKKATAKDLPAETEPEKGLGDNEKRSETTQKDETKQGLSVDGTDDHLHAALQPAKVKKPGTSEHADIESIQESAEIAGKVVLLSRGGCGFLEKVMWAQRRGGMALIVGDDVVGGPLVTMYAKGDTSNVTIPALFTSHTTAHLLSSLIPPGGFSIAGAEDTTPPDSKEKLKGKTQKPAKDDKPGSTSTDTSPFVPSVEEEKSTPATQEPEKPRRGWFSSLLSFIGFGSPEPSGVSRRPPSSGHVDWVQVEDCLDCEAKGKPHKAGKGSKGSKSTPPQDDFVIGVQDWRDPDMLHPDMEDEQSVKARDTQKPKKEAVKSGDLIKGNSIVPGSGEYEKPGARIDTIKSFSQSKGETAKSHGSWFGHLFGSSESTSGKPHGASEKTPQKPPALHIPAKGPKKLDANKPDRHEGLWVTLTPTNMSSSPFFDTLLVLVVSPLVTLTVVYALLLLRSRIRRRRWRAPKSVVDRLPVRTYHTLSNEASTSALATPISSSPTTPLLQSSSRRVLPRSQSRHRPRSFTTSEVPEQSSSSPLTDRHAQSTSNETEKREAGLAEWRRRYGGRQKECVVCLEEYVDGVSRVMSLPCGHEFHAECITPWLTTRRRTCPICKGDVVRSMARQSGRLSEQSSYNNDRDRHLNSEDEDDVQEEAATNRNDSPSAALPIQGYEEPDLERGERPRGRSNQSSRSPARSGWNIFNNWGFIVPGTGSSSSSSSSGRRSPREDIDRDR